MKSSLFFLSSTALIILLCSFIFFSEKYESVNNHVYNYNYLKKHIELAEELNKPLIINETVKISKDLIVNTSIEGKGKIITTNSARVIIRGNNLTVRGITIDGLNSGRGLYFFYSSNCNAENVSVVNVIGGGITLQTCDNSRIYNCYTKNTSGKYGDGLIALNSKNSIFENNTCLNFQRAGIVVDWSGEKKSENPKIINNKCSDAVKSIDGQLNAGIWLENCKGGLIKGNTVKNTILKGIVVTPNIKGESFKYIVSDNIVMSSNEGLNFVYASNQILNESNNQYIDVKNIFEIGDCSQAILKNSVFKSQFKDRSYFNSIVRFNPLPDTKTELVIEGCKNLINGDETPVDIWNQYRMRADIYVKDCIGNFSISINENSLYGNVYIDNCLLDYNHGKITSYFCNNTGVFKITNSKVKLKNINNFRVQAGEFIVVDCELSSSSNICSLFIGQYGTRNIQLINSKFTNIHFYDLVQSNSLIYLNGVTAKGFPKEGFISSNVRIKDLTVINSEFQSAKIDEAINIKASNNVILNNKLKN